MEVVAADQASEGTEGKSRWTWLVPLGLLVLLVGLYFVAPGYRDFVDRGYDLIRSGKIDELQSWVKGFGFWGPLLIFAMMLAQTLLAFIPSLLVMIVAVLAYGPLWGFLLTWTGLLIAAFMAYFIGRALGPVTVDRLIGHKAEKRLEEYVERYGMWGIIAARISPALSNDAVSYVAGLLGMSFLRFGLATALGILPLATLVAVLGENIDSLRSTLIWVSVISIALFVGYVIYDHRRSRGI